MSMGYRTRSPHIGHGMTGGFRVFWVAFCMPPCVTNTSCESLLTMLLDADRGVAWPAGCLRAAAHATLADCTPELFSGEGHSCHDQGSSPGYGRIRCLAKERRLTKQCIDCSLILPTPF